MSSKKTLVLGASENPARYSNMAVKKLKAYGHEVIAIGRKKGMIADTPIETDTNMQPEFTPLHSTSMPQTSRRIMILSYH
jgi:hypothetical protein